MCTHNDNFQGMRLKTGLITSSSAWLKPNSPSLTKICSSAHILELDHWFVHSICYLKWMPEFSRPPPISSLPTQRYHCYLLISVLHASIDTEGKGWGSSSRRLGSGLSVVQASLGRVVILDMTVSQNINIEQGCSKPTTKYNKNKITVKPKKYQTHSLIKKSNCSTLPVIALSLLWFALSTDKPLRHSRVHRFAPTFWYHLI